MGKNITHKRIIQKNEEYYRQSNLKSCCMGFEKIKIYLLEFLNKTKYKNNNFDWKVFINNLHGNIKQIILTNNVKLSEKPYKLISQHFNKLNKLTTTNKIVTELNLLLNTLNTLN